MTTENLTPSDHRQALQQLLHASRLPHHLNAFALVPGPTAAAAIEWALDQTQEPAPPPGGWSECLPNPEACIRLLVDLDRLASAEAPPKDIWVYPAWLMAPQAIQWALPILRRAANLTQDGPIQKTDPEPVGTPLPKSFPILTRWIDLCNMSTNWVTIIAGEWPPQNVIPHDIVPTIDLKAEILAATGAPEETQDQEDRRASRETPHPTPAQAPNQQSYAASARLALSKIQDPESKTEITTHEWIPALAALARRELRFWKETGEVSGTVTRRAASRVIRGLEQIIKTIPANLRDS